jgi:hypothetical protein
VKTANNSSQDGIEQKNINFTEDFEQMVFPSFLKSWPFTQDS